MTPKTKFQKIILVVFFFFTSFGALSLKAQVPPTQITPSNETGTNPFGSYSTDAGNINLSNGNLSLNIPILSLPGRNGHNFVLALEYDSKIWSPSAVYSNTGADITYSWKAEKRTAWVGDLGWRFNWSGVDPGAWDTDQYGYLVAVDGNTLTLPDGSKHYISARGPVMDAEDGSSITVYNDTNYNLVRAFLKDGSTIFSSDPNVTPEEDTNGNYIKFNTPNTYTDTLGRQITITTPNSRGASTSISYKDSNGVLQTTTLNYTQIPLFQPPTGPLQYQTPQPPFAYPVQTTCGGICRRHVWVHQPPNVGPWMLTSVVLPDNTKYTFTYNGYAELTKVTYPTGGYTAYDYAAFQHQETYWQISPRGQSDFREVTARRICRDPAGSCNGGTTEDKTTFTPTIDYSQPANTAMDVVSPKVNPSDPSGYKDHYEFTHVATDPTYARYDSARETLHQTYSETGALLRTVRTSYIYLDGLAPGFPSTVTTSLNDTGGTALVTKTDYIYDTFSATVMWPPYDPANGVDYTNQTATARTRPIDNPTQILEYNYGSGAAGTLARKTVNTGLKVNAANNNVDYSSQAVHIWNRKSDTQVFDSGSSKFSETQYEYDNYSANAITPTGATQHDAAYGVTNKTRGNLTAIKRWRNTDSAFLTTQFAYDDAGNATKAIDPLGHTTLMSYADSWGNNACVPATGNAAAYLTSVTDALNHVVSAKYNSCTGTVALTCPSFCTKFNERVYITAIGCEFGFGTHGLQAAGAGGL